MIFFYLMRDEDGKVAEGVIFSSNKVVLHWLGAIKTIVVHDSMENVQNLHCHGGKTRIVYDKI